MTDQYEKIVHQKSISKHNIYNLLNVNTIMIEDFIENIFEYIDITK